MASRDTFAAGSSKDPNGLRSMEEVVEMRRGNVPCKVVTQHIIRLTYFEELLLRFAVIWIDVGMVKFGQLKIYLSNRCDHKGNYEVDYNRGACE